jgi:ATP-dependent DNA helicase RecG
MNPNLPVSALAGVGKKTVQLLSRLKINTVADLIYYFPFRYEDYRRIVPIDQVVIGEQITVKGKIEIIANKRSFKKRKTITECLLRDDTGTMRVVWFNQPFLTSTLHAGDVVYISGKVSSDMLGVNFVSPVYEKETSREAVHTARLVPVYALTAGLTQKQIRLLLSQVITKAAEVPDWLPEELRQKIELIPLPQALHDIHFPENDTQIKLSTDRLKFDELCMVQMHAVSARIDKAKTNAPTLIFQEEKIRNFVQSLKFQLTNSQKKSAWEILQDISKPIAMNRLLSGDVGSGKTVVAAMASYSVFLNQAQVAIMVPTEILAHQHFESLSQLLIPYGVRVGLFTRNQRVVADETRIINNESGIMESDVSDEQKLSKTKILESIKNQEVDVIVGTQAFLSEKVEFKNLGLVVVDEQHRFGVEQRRIIKEKGLGAHFLSMTATPIPRSLALMIYGDLDVSIINELPPGRKPVLTRLVEPHKRDKAYQFIDEQIKLGRQVFVVCPLIENNPDAQNTEKNKNITPTLFSLVEKKTVMDEFKKLAEKIFPHRRVGFLHGKLKPNEKEETMSKFGAHELDILVSTSVIEVGVNIPNASIMMIEGADRFGLAQLHQFRGRVGRSTHQSYCLLFTDSATMKTQERLHFFEHCHDGFKLAEKDLEIRGPGEVYGTEQSGMMQLKLAKLTDQSLIKKAQEVAQEVVPHMHDFPAIQERMKNWRDAVHLE